METRYNQFIKVTPTTNFLFIFPDTRTVKEGAFLYASGINPYDGDMYHENPIILVLSNALIRKCPSLVPFVFIAIDLMTAILLHQMSKRFVTSMVCFFFFC